MINRPAYFISPVGDLIKIEGSHIGYVINNPGLFDWTIEEITRIYQKYKEPLGFEGKARHEILLRIIAQGWVRIRRYKAYWSITIHDFNDSKSHLQKWALHIDDFPCSPVLINELESSKEYYLPNGLQFLMDNNSIN